MATSSVRTGQRWALTSLPAPVDCEPHLYVWQADDEVVEVVIAFVPSALSELGVRGTVLRVTPTVFTASNLKLLVDEATPPDWLPKADSDEDLPERRTWAVLEQGTIQEQLGNDVRWLRSLTCALDRGDAELAARIVAQIPLTLCETFDQPPLHRVVARGDQALTELFLRHGADISATDDAGRTALHLAAAEGQAVLVALLVDRGAPLEARDADNLTPLRAALVGDQLEVAALLEQRGALLDPNALLRLGRFGEARAALEAGPAFLQDATHPERLLHDMVEYLRRAEEPAAAVSEALVVARLLLDQGLDPMENFPLRDAVTLPDTGLAQLLLEHGADPNQGTAYGDYLLPTPARGMAMRQLLRSHKARSSEDADVVFPEANACLEADPDDVDARLKRAWAWWQMGQYQQAQQDLDALFSTDADHAPGKRLQGWIWATCPDDNMRDGAQALAIAEEIQSTFLCGISFELDGSKESWTITDHEELQAAALAEQGEFDQALAILDELEGKNAGWEERERMAKMRACFEAETPFRHEPVSAELEEFGRQQAELIAIAETAQIVDEGEEAEDDDAMLLTFGAVGEIAIEGEADDGASSAASDERAGGLSIDDKGELLHIGSFGVADFKRLANHPRLDELKSLRVRCGEIPAEVGLSIATSLRPPRLCCLELDDCSFSDRVGIVLAGITEWPALTELRLTKAGLTRRTAEAIAANPAWAQLTKLSLYINTVRTRGARALAASPYLASLEELDLSMNFIRDEGVRLLAQSPHLRRLQSLKLSSNRLYDQSVTWLTESPLLGQLRVLDLGSNRLGEETGLRLAAAPAMANLEDLNLTSNPIGPKAMLALVQSPYCAQLQTLHIDGCKIDDAAAFALISSPHLKNLKTLFASESDLSLKARKALEKRFVDGHLSIW